MIHFLIHILNQSIVKVKVISGRNKECAGALFTPSLEEIKSKLNSKHTYFPVAQPIDMDHAHWFTLYTQVSAGLPYHALLESGRSGRFSFMVYHPAYTLQARAGEITIQQLNSTGQADQTIRKKGGTALQHVQEWLQARQAPRFSHLPDFQGGLVGFFSYDLVREWESLPELSRDDLDTPDLYLVGYEQVLVYDHKENQHWLIIYQPVEQGKLEFSYQQAQEKLSAWGAQVQTVLHKITTSSEKSLARLAEKLVSSASNHGNSRGASLNSEAVGYAETSYSRESFGAAVDQVKEHLAAGEVFQVNLSVRQETKLEADPVQIYACLREINPSPYMCYLHFPHWQVISASPEQLVKVQGNKVTTRPIGGTRPRGKSQLETSLLTKELLANEKEQAEHIMLVDLVRNDLSKVCSYGSVQVNELMVIEEYSHVIHLVSNIEAELVSETSPLAVLQAVFPGGTITGAPKLRTMEIIEELEPVRRGMYTGSIGWIDYTGDMELNIVIRTMIAKAGQVFVQAGAGVVSESVPEKEYAECLKKAEALWTAYELAKQGTRPREGE